MTAQRREEQLQDVPIAIAAIGGAQLQSQGVTNVVDLQQVVPGLNYTRALGTYGLPFIRGIGTTSQNGENPVATYIDGVFIANNAGSVMSLRDIDQVAVLKGPQGTLFGRNAVGGLIQVTTRRPSFTPTLELEGTVGNLKSHAESLYASAGINDRLAVSLSVLNDQQNKGWGRNLYTGEYVNTRDNIAGRFKILWAPDDKSDITFTADYAHNINAAPVNRVFGVNAFGQAMAGGPFDTNLNVQPKSDVLVKGFGLNANRELGPVKLVSITGYRRTKFHTRFDADGSTNIAQQNEGWNSNNAFTQELQLLSNTDSRFSWVTGLFFMDSSTHGWTSNTSRRLPAPSGAPPFTRLPVLPNYAAVNIGQTWSDSYGKLKSYAAYAQGAYAIDDATNLTVGLRYTKDDRTTTQTSYTRTGAQNPVTPPSGPVTQNAATATAPNPASNEVTFSDPSWRLSLDHRFSEEVMGYLSYNRGFRAGDFQSATSTTYLDPETLDAFEAGFKSDLFGRTLRINGAAYYYIDKGRKSVQIIGGQGTLFNAQRAELYGFDADMTWLATDQLTIFAGLSGIHARYKEVTPGPVTTPGAPFNYPGNILYSGDNSGNTLEATPTWTFNFAPSYRLPTGVGEFKATLNYYYNDGWFAAPDNRVKQPSYSTWAADVLWTPSFSDRITVRFWGKNLSNKVYWEQFSETTQSDNYQVGAGRSYGVTVGARF